jgi:hypothetical protein
MSPEDNAKKVKEALEQFDHAVRPVVSDVLGLAEKALQRAHGSVGDIASAAVRVGAAQADLIASTAKAPTPPKTTPH